VLEEGVVDRPKRRLSGALTALIGVGATSIAAAQPLEHDARGAGVLTTARGPVAVSGVTYVTRDEPRRHSFSATTAMGTVTFSGGEAAWRDATHAQAPIDSVLRLTREGFSDDAASGVCDFEISADATYLKTVACRATTAGGDYALRFEAAG
jgi:hypothetical protein